MSQISKCPKIRAFLSYWEALGEVSELRYKNLPHAVIKSIIYLYIQPYLMPWLFGERSWISPTQLLHPLLQLCDLCCLNSQQSVVLRSQRVGLSHIFDSIAALTVYDYATCLLLTGVHPFVQLSYTVSLFMKLRVIERNSVHILSLLFSTGQF